jgi:hypothetical protein
MVKVKVWDVFRDGQEIDRITTDPDMEADTVRRSLIHHDGYPSDIEVKLHKF